PGTSSMTMALLTGGTKTMNALQISDRQELLGAQISAGSNLDLSTVHLSSLKSKLDDSLSLYADVVLNPSFPQSDFDRQQKQTLAGIKREENSPVASALRVMPGLLYGSGHAYGNPLTGSGTSTSVAKMTREDLAKFHDAWFKPNNATLIIVGDTTLSEVTPKLEKLFSGWKSGGVPKKNVKTVDLPAKSTVYLIDKPGAQQSVIVAGVVAPPEGNPKEIAIEAMNDGLGGNFGARLNMNLREDKHWSYGASMRFWDARGQRPYLAIAPVQTDKTKESLIEMNKEFHDVVGSRPLSQEELEKVQANETLSLPGSRETQNAVGGSILDLVQFGLPDDYYETYAGKVHALKTSDLADAAHLVVHPDQLTWVIVGDRAKIEAGVKELNLGELKYLGADGKPLAN
ncbi:MAG TPA: pitrilysin family protein, partial [Pyrinomonadaceae bacterium]|nr:pitrilysin family protein [Pyrinomonadaceae bacterium]